MVEESGQVELNNASAVKAPTGLVLMCKLLGSRDLINLESEWHNCLITIPFKVSDALTVPYGRADIPYLNRLLYNSDWIVVSKALHTLVEKVHDAFKAMDLIRLRVLDAFVTLMRHKEPFIRQRCCIVIKILSGQPLGKVTIMMNVNLVEMMLKGLSDEDYRVRFHCAASVLALADQRVGNEAMAECGFLERVLQRVYEEQDSRIIPLLLRTISRLMATNDSVRKKITQRDLQLFLSMNQKTEVTKILAETFDSDWLASRGILEYLKCGMRSHSYEVVLNCVMCMLRAATVLESKIFLAERNTMNLLVTFALAPSMKGRALKEFALQLLCILVETTYGRKYIMGQKILVDELSKNSEPSCQSYIKKFKDILRAQY